jgi:hypothetical protein
MNSTKMPSATTSLQDKREVPLEHLWPVGCGVCAPQGSSCGGSPERRPGRRSRSRRRRRRSCRLRPGRRGRPPRTRAPAGP